MMMPSPGQPAGPKLQPIVQPGTSPWAQALVSPQITPGLARYQAALAGTIVVALSAAVALGTASAAGAIVAVLIVAALIAVGVLGFRSAAPRVILGGSGCRFQGVPITGATFDLLIDIQQRFAYAERMIGELPTGLRWSDVADEVATLMWESLPQAARVSALETEISEMRYATSGTPQAALLKSLEQRHEEYLEILRATQREADSLARTAGNAVAAARVALARTGDLSKLEVAAPSGRAIMARSALAEARARLAILTDVWNELDDSTALLAEKVELERPPEQTPGSSASS